MSQINQTQKPAERSVKTSQTQAPLGFSLNEVQKEIWEIILPAEFNYFRIKTKNPVQTLQKVLPKAGVVAVCPPSQKSMVYFYLDEDEFKKLINGESVKVTTTTIPFNGYGKGVCEAWGTITISLNFFLR